MDVDLVAAFFHCVVRMWHTGECAIQLQTGEFFIAQRRALRLLLQRVGLQNLMQLPHTRLAHGGYFHTMSQDRCHFHLAPCTTGEGCTWSAAIHGGTEANLLLDPFGDPDPLPHPGPGADRVG